MIYKILQDYNGFYVRFKRTDGFFWRKWYYLDIVSNPPFFLNFDVDAMHFDSEKDAKKSFLTAYAEYERQKLERLTRVEYNKDAEEVVVSDAELAKYLTQKDLKEKP